MARRQFLRMLALSSAAVVLPVPLTALASRRPPFDLLFPQDPLNTWFDPTFGAAKPDGRTHMGIDLMGPKHSPVYSVANGIISRIGQSPRAGRYMVIDHVDGWQSWYLHLNDNKPGGNRGRAGWEFAVAEGLEEGSRVAAGQHVAFVGDSGNAKGGMSHTHFELHTGSRIVNPYHYLVAAQAVAKEVAYQQQLAEHQEQLEETIRVMCEPDDAVPAIDPQLCAPDTDAPIRPRWILPPL
jgi:murein DD-endopeptidase MepM/ murein hydrolase activator NlpD